MAKVTIADSTLESIGNAIRGKLGVSTTYKPTQMASAISSIETPNLGQITATTNGVYTPPTGKNGISQAVVNVANSYAAADEGKVVSNGALVAQTSTTKTANGTYDTTLNNEVVINVESQTIPDATGVSF